MNQLSTDSIDRILKSRSNVSLKHLDFVDGGMDGPAMMGEKRGAEWAANEADFVSLANLAKVRAALSDRQWENGFHKDRTPSGAAAWFYSLIDPAWPTGPDDDCPGMFWGAVDTRGADLTPDYVLGFADGALAVFEAVSRVI